MPEQIRDGQHLNATRGPRIPYWKRRLLCVGAHHCQLSEKTTAEAAALTPHAVLASPDACPRLAP